MDNPFFLLRLAMLKIKELEEQNERLLDQIDALNGQIEIKSREEGRRVYSTH